MHPVDEGLETFSHSFYLNPLLHFLHCYHDYQGNIGSRRQDWIVRRMWCMRVPFSLQHGGSVASQEINSSVAAGETTSQVRRHLIYIL